MTENRIEIGALGYQHPGWDDQYYPDGLPEDWRLDYYNHHFQFVVLQANEWLNADEDDMRQWVEDVKDSFQFFLSIPAADITAAVVEQVKRIKACLQQRLQGLVVLHYDIGLPDSLLDGLSETTTLHVDAETDVRLPTNVKPCWRKDRQLNACVIGLLPSEEAADIRKMRAHIEAFMQVCDTQQAYLVFEGKPPPSKPMQDAQVILQMLA